MAGCPIRRRRAGGEDPALASRPRRATRAPTAARATLPTAGEARSTPRPRTRTTTRTTRGAGATGRRLRLVSNGDEVVVGQPLLARRCRRGASAGARPHRRTRLPVGGANAVPTTSRPIRPDGERSVPPGAADEPQTGMPQPGQYAPPVAAPAVSQPAHPAYGMPPPQRCAVRRDGGECRRHGRRGAERRGHRRLRRRLRHGEGVRRPSNNGPPS